MNSIDTIKPTILLTSVNTPIMAGLLAHFLAEDKYRVLCPKLSCHDSEAITQIRKLLEGSADETAKQCLLDNAITRIKFVAIDFSSCFGSTTWEFDVLLRERVEQVWHQEEIQYEPSGPFSGFSECNLLATRNVLRFCHLAQHPTLHYVRPGWSANTAGIVDCHLHRNEFTASAIAAEKIIREAKIPVRIYNTPITIFTECSANANYYGSIFYSLLVSLTSFMAWVEDRAPGFYQRFPLHLYQPEAKYLGMAAPEDVVADIFLYTAKTENSPWACYNISPATELSGVALERVTQEIFSKQKIKITSNLRELNSLDQLFMDRIPFFYSALSASRRHGCPAKSFVQKKGKNFLFHYLLMQKNENQHAIELLRESLKVEITCRHGRPLQYTKIGSGSPIVLVNALGASPELWRYIISHLALKHTVITWEPRGLSGHGAPELNSDILFTHLEQAADLKEILENEEIKSAHIIGYCLGCLDSLTFHGQYPTFVRSLTLISGKYAEIGEYALPQAKSMEELAYAVSEQPEMASSFVHFLQELFEKRVNVDEIDRPDLQNATDQIAGMLNPEVASFVNHWFLNKETLTRYFATQSQNAKLFNIYSMLEEIEVPVFFLAGKNDQAVSFKHTQWLGKKIPKSKVVIFPGGTHWLLIENGIEVSHALASLLGSIEN